MRNMLRHELLKMRRQRSVCWVDCHPLARPVRELAQLRFLDDLRCHWPKEMFHSEWLAMGCSATPLAANMGIKPQTTIRMPPAMMRTPPAQHSANVSLQSLSGQAVNLGVRSVQVEHRNTFCHAIENWLVPTDADWQEPDPLANTKFLKRGRRR